MQFQSQKIQHSMILSEFFQVLPKTMLWFTNAQIAHSKDTRSITEWMLISETISNDSKNHEANAQSLNSYNADIYYCCAVSTPCVYFCNFLCFIVISYIVLSYFLSPTYADMPIILTYLSDIISVWLTTIIMSFFCM